MWDLDLQSLFGLPCAQLFSLAETPQIGSNTRALLVSQDRRHLFVIPGFNTPVKIHWWR